MTRAAKILGTVKEARKPNPKALKNYIELWIKRTAKKYELDPKALTRFYGEDTKGHAHGEEAVEAWIAYDDGQWYDYLSPEAEFPKLTDKIRQGFIHGLEALGYEAEDDNSWSMSIHLAY